MNKTYKEHKAYIEKVAEEMINNLALLVESKLRGYTEDSWWIPDGLPGLVAEFVDGGERFLSNALETLKEGGENAVSATAVTLIETLPENKKRIMYRNIAKKLYPKSFMIDAAIERHKNILRQKTKKINVVFEKERKACFELIKSDQRSVNYLETTEKNIGNLTYLSDNLFSTYCVLSKQIPDASKAQQFILNRFNKAFGKKIEYIKEILEDENKKFYGRYFQKTQRETNEFLIEIKNYINVVSRGIIEAYSEEQEIRQAIEYQKQKVRAERQREEEKMIELRQKKIEEQEQEAEKKRRAGLAKFYVQDTSGKYRFFLIPEERISYEEKEEGWIKGHLYENPRSYVWASYKDLTEGDYEATRREFSMRAKNE